jgi:Domain of unknown function (DUF397)
MSSEDLQRRTTRRFETYDRKVTSARYVLFVTRGRRHPDRVERARAPQRGADVRHSSDGGMTFVKSTYSSNGCTCVEVAIGAGRVGVRDSKLSTSPILVFDAEAWRAFIADVRLGLHVQ